MNHYPERLGIQLVGLVISGLIGACVIGFPFLLTCCISLALLAAKKDISLRKKTFSWIASLVFGVLGIGILVIALIFTINWR